MPIFIFDLDGTITKEETLPLIAKHFNVEAEINELTEKTIRGNVPFIESFITRVNILGKFPVNEVADLLEKVNLYPKLHSFVLQNSNKCAIATGNLDCWIEKLAQKVGCACYNSTAELIDNKVVKLHRILKKENIVERYQQEGEQVIFIGDGNNDMEAMRKADISIACGLTHYPANSVLSIADYAVFNEEALCRLLNQLL